MSNNIWAVTGVDPKIRKQVKLYAVEHDISIGEALNRLLSQALSEPEAGVNHARQ